MFKAVKKEIINEHNKTTKSSLDFDFEDLEKKILQEVVTSSPTSKRSSNNLIYGFIASAAAILLLIGLFEKPTTVEIEKEQALNDFIESYYLEDFDSYEMLSMMEDNEIESPFDQITKP